MFQPLALGGRLLIRYWPALLTWSLLGGIGFRVAMQAAAWANGWPAVPPVIQSVLALALVALAILFLIATTISMFFTVREGMPGLARLRMIQRDVDRMAKHRTPAPNAGPRSPPNAGPNAAQDAAPDAAPNNSGYEPSFLDFLVVSAIPFVTLYETWGFIEQYVNALTFEAMQRFEGVPTLGNEVFIGFILAGVVAYLLFRAFGSLEQSRAPGERIWRLFATYCEMAYLFFAIYGLVELFARIPGWIAGRAFWVALTDALDGVFPDLLGVWLGMLWEFVGTLQSTVLVPIIWLTITAVVYGHLLDRSDDMVDRSSVLQRLRAGVDRLPEEVRFLVHSCTAESREKWIPLLNALRMVWRGGVVFLLVFVLEYLLLELGVRWGVIGITHLIGPWEFENWVLTRHLLEDVPTLLFGPLRTCLLAAVFDAALRKISQEPVEPSGPALPASSVPATPPDAARWHPPGR